MTKPTKEQMSALRWLSLITLLALFVSDYGLDAWAKPVPTYAYGICIAIAIGIDVPTLRDLLLQFLRNTVSNDKKNT